MAKIKAHSLTGRITETLVLAAFRNVKRNRGAAGIDKVNAVVRGTANYFATAFSSCDKQFGVLDKWLRMRIRSMKFKRKRATDNWRLWRQHFRNLGFEFLCDACVPAVVEPT